MKFTVFPLKIAAVMCAFSLILTSFSACSEKSAELSADALSDVITIKISGTDEKKNEAVLSAVKKAVEDTEKSVSAKDESSELSILNSTKTIYASDFFRGLINDCLLIADTTKKAANISIGEITSLWGFYGDSPAVPDEAVLEKAVKGVGMWNIELSQQNNKISIPSDLSVDLYSIQNGIVLDSAYEAVKLFNTPMMFTLKNTVLACGQGPSDGCWKIDVTSADGTKTVATLRLEPAKDLNMLAVSTSFITDCSFTEDGRTYHRYVSPKTGYPVETDLVSVTVRASSALNADALSSACFITGLCEDTLTYLSYFGADALFIFADGTYYATEGFSDSLSIKDRNLTPASTDIITD